MENFSHLFVLSDDAEAEIERFAESMTNSEQSKEIYAQGCKDILYRVLAAFCGEDYFED